jgi:hypothetical protein
MKRLWLSACVLPAMLSLTSQIHAQDRARYEKMIAKHARANLVPEALVHRLIVRESKYNPALIGHGGTIGLMQLKLATAKGVGYTGDADGLRDPETNLIWGVKYLAGAYRAAGGDYDRAIRYFAGGYYYVAKQQRLDHLKQGKPDLGAAPPKIAVVADKRASPTEDTAQAAPADSSKPEDAPAKPVGAPLKLLTSRPVQAATKPKTAKKALADAKGQVPRPTLPGGANSAHPR